MALENLKIKQLSQTGELLGLIACHAGQISVFRATDPNFLAPYIRALAGLPGPERFSISLDDQNFSPAEHNLIGYGEKFSAAKGGETAAQYLVRHGAPEQGATAALAAAGLDHCAEKACSSLTACEERRLRILGATFQPNKALVLNDPFDPISTQWRERFAELLIAFVRGKKGLVVVPMLSNRPQSWIDNELIARVQVGENIQKTIGFGSAPSEIHQVLKKIRSEASHTPSVLGSGGEDSSPSADSGQADGEEIPGSLLEAEEPSASFTKRPVAFFASAFILLIVLGLLIGRFLRPSAQQIDLASSDTVSASSVQSSALASSLAESSEQKSSSLSAAEASSSASEEVRVAHLLDLYPETIRTSIIESFEGTATLDLQNGAPSYPRLSQQQERERAVRPAPKANTSDLLTVLQATSSKPGDEQAQPAAAPTPNEDEVEAMTPEQRREVIRQRFLEAIQKAAQNNQ